MVLLQGTARFRNGCCRGRREGARGVWQLYMQQAAAPLLILCMNGPGSWLSISRHIKIKDEDEVSKSPLLILCMNERRA